MRIAESMPFSSALSELPEHPNRRVARGYCRHRLIGPRMMGLLLFMKGTLHASYTGMEEFLDHVMGFKVCRGYLAKVMAREVRVLEPAMEELRALLPTQRVLNVDETGHKENGEGM